MLRSNLKTGISCGIFYGLGVLFLEDMVALFINQMEFSFIQIGASLILYIGVFTFLGFFIATFFSAIGSRFNRFDVLSIGTIFMWLSAFTVFYIGYDGVDDVLFFKDLTMKMILLLGWGLVVSIAFFLIFKLLKRGRGLEPGEKDARSIALGAMLTVFVIVTVKIRCDPIAAARVSSLVPWWPILAVLFSLGIFILTKTAVDKIKAIRGFNHKFAAIGLLLVIGTPVLGQYVYFRPGNIPVPPVVINAENTVPNVLFIVIDALRFDHMSLYGYNRETTYWISEYSKKGVVFVNALAVASCTKQSVASIFTSRYPGTNGMDEPFDPLSLLVSTLPEVLHRNGYFTKGLSGNRFMSPDYNFDQGFDDFTYLPGHKYKQLLRPKIVLNNNYSGYVEFFYRMGFIDGTTAYGDAHSINKCIIPWLKRHNDKRFFLYLHYMEPHFPYYPIKRHYSARNYLAGEDLKSYRKLFWFEDVPENHDSLHRTLVNRYDDEIRQIDSNLKDLFQILDETNLWENTLVIITADHGDELLDHGFLDHGHTMYQELLHVPLIIIFPDGRGAGQTIMQRVDLLDLAPTLYDYLGISPPEVLEGVSLLPLIAGEEESYRFSKRRYFCEVQPSREQCHFRMISAMIEDEYKLIRSIEKSPESNYQVSLFDLSIDPEERVNLADSLSEAVGEMLVRLETFRSYCDSLGALLPTSAEVNLDDTQLEQLRALGYVR